jgi:hypothetical protein
MTKKYNCPACKIDFFTKKGLLIHNCFVVNEEYPNLAIPNYGPHIPAQLANADPEVGAVFDDEVESNAQEEEVADNGMNFNEQVDDDDALDAAELEELDSSNKIKKLQKKIRLLCTKSIKNAIHLGEHLSQSRPLAIWDIFEEFKDPENGSVSIRHPQILGRKRMSNEVAAAKKCLYRLCRESLKLYERKELRAGPMYFVDENGTEIGVTLTSTIFFTPLLQVIDAMLLDSGMMDLGYFPFGPIQLDSRFHSASYMHSRSCKTAYDEAKLKAEQIRNRTLEKSEFICLMIGVFTDGAVFASHSDEGAEMLLIQVMNFCSSAQNSTRGTREIGYINCNEKISHPVPSASRINSILRHHQRAASLQLALQDVKSVVERGGRWRTSIVNRFKTNTKHM